MKSFCKPRFRKKTDFGKGTQVTAGKQGRNEWRKMKERKRATVTASKGSKDRKADKEKEEMQNDKKRIVEDSIPFSCVTETKREKK